MFPCSLSEWTTNRHPLKCVAAGYGLVALSAISPIKGGKQVHLSMGLAPRLKTVLNVTVGFHEYGMINASNSRWGIPRQQPPKGTKRGAFIYRNDVDTKKVSNLSLGFPEYGMANDSNFRRGLPLPRTPKGSEKGGIYLWE